MPTQLRARDIVESCRRVSPSAGDGILLIADGAGYPMSLARGNSTSPSGGIASTEERQLRGNEHYKGGVDPIGAQHEERPIRALVFLEASTVAGAVKPVLEFAREAAEATKSGALNLTMVLYERAGQESSLLSVVQDQGIAEEIISERHSLDMRALRQLREIGQKQRPHIIWTNNTKSHFLVYLSGLHRTAKWIAFHHGYTKEALRTRVYNELDRLSLPHAQRVVTVCNDFAQKLHAKGVPSDRLRVVRNPIRVTAPVSEAEKAQFRNKLGLNDESVLLSVGRLSQEKGHADLLRAIALMRSNLEGAFRSKLILVGDGPECGRLQALCAGLGLEDVVRFAGYEADVRPYYAISDIFILPSHSEGSPNVLLEAMAAGVPTVATAVGGLPEVLSNEVNALLVPKENPAQLATAIARLLNEQPLRQQFIEKSKEVVAQHNPESYYRNIMGLFEEVLNETPTT